MKHINNSIIKSKNKKVKENINYYLCFFKKTYKTKKQNMSKLDK